MLTTRYVTGAPNWIDLGTPDLDGALAFYREIFGWQFQSAGPEAGGYGIFQIDGKSVAGGMTVTAEQGPPSWSVYFQTPDADATANSVEGSGGSVPFKPMDVMDQGRMAMFADPAGAGFGVWQPAANKGLDVAGDNHALCWTELYTPDVAAATGFYGAVLGWLSDEASFPGGTYTMVRPAEGDEDSAFGGVVALADDPVEKSSSSFWLLYFAVDDADATCARAKELGGSVRVEPVDIEGVGRIAKLADPSGAKFAIIRPAPRHT